MTRTSFEQAMRKGRVGESVVRSALERAGFCVYEPQTSGSHAFDILAIKNNERCIALDVKTKARRNKYPDTGINMRHYRVYKEFSERHSMPFWVIFVDEWLGSVYGNTLDELCRPRVVEGRQYPMEWRSSSGSTIYWPLDAMVTLGPISDECAQELICMSQRSHGYGVGQSGDRQSVDTAE